MTRTSPAVASYVAEQAAAHDARRASRTFAALIVPIGPLAIALLRSLLPYYTTDSASTIVEKIALHQGRANAVVWLGFVGVLTMVPSVIFVGRYVGRAAPRLTAAAVLLMAPGYSVLGFLVAADALVWFGVQHQVPTATLAPMYTAYHPVTAVAGVVFVVGHVLGTVLLGVAMIRGGSVSTWVGVITVVCQPLHFIAAVVLPSHALDGVAWGLNAVAFGVVSAALLRLPDDQWAPGPLT
jgi:hypothetical protein